MNYDRFYGEALNATDILFHKFPNKQITFFLTKPAFNLIRKETAAPPGYKLMLFGRPVKIVEGDEARVYIGVELKWVNDGKSLDGK